MGEEAIPSSFCPLEFFILLCIFYFQLVVGTYAHMIPTAQKHGTAGQGSWRCPAPLELCNQGTACLSASQFSSPGLCPLIYKLREMERIADAVKFHYLVIRWIVALSSSLVLIPGTCKYVTLHGQRDFAAVIKWRILTCGDDPGLAGRALNVIESVLLNGKQEGLEEIGVTRERGQEQRNAGDF